MQPWLSRASGDVPIPEVKVANMPAIGCLKWRCHKFEDMPKWLLEWLACQAWTAHISPGRLQVRLESHVLDSVPWLLHLQVFLRPLRNLKLLSGSGRLRLALSSPRWII